MEPLAHLIEQLWSPAFAEGTLRVVATGAASGWLDVERYWMVPDAAHARLLIPRAESRVVVAAATNYRGLRPWQINLARGLGGSLARLRLPLGLATARVQVRAERPEAARRLPLAQLASALGRRRLFASVGVRTGANRKATLSLLDGRGTPVGHAKFGWNSVADRFVEVESWALGRVGAKAGTVRAPRAIASLDYFGHPVLVTEPLPLDAVSALHGVSPPTTQEFYALTGLDTPTRPGATQHLVSLHDRLTDMADAPLTALPAGSALRLLERLRHYGTELPTTRLWHGDMSPWNAARTPSGTLWIWDWETAENHATAGLDPLHWAFSEHRLRHGSAAPIVLADVMAEAAAHLLAVGIAPIDHSVIAAIYVLTVVERACRLAHRDNGWDNVWIGLTTLHSLLTQAESLLPA